MRTHLSNATYGVFDYAAYPFAMLLAAPTLLHSLGTAQYGIWIVCTAAGSTGGIIASGFGDANIQHVATQRSRGDAQALIRAVRSLVGINLVLGSVIVLIALAISPLLSRHVVAPGSNLYTTCLWSLRLASVSMLARALESVCISTQRAFERYGEAVRIGIFVRITTIAIAVILVRFGYGVTSIMAVTVTLMSLGTMVQGLKLRRLTGAQSLWPVFDREAFDALFGFGIFSWLQAISSVIFSQADRLILGALLGATAVTSYALCVQMAQPIYGIAAAGLHFLFPYLASHQGDGKTQQVRKAIVLACAANLAFVAFATTVLLIWGHRLVRLWVGEEIAQGMATVFLPIVLSFALLGLSVTGYYALLALGRVRIVTTLNVLGGTSMLALAAWLLPEVGIRAVALARLAYGIVAVTVYFPLLRMVFFVPRIPRPAREIRPAWEES